MNDLKSLQEAYCKICESVRDPMYFGPPDKKETFLNWLKLLKHEVHENGSVSIDGEVSFSLSEFGQRGMFNNVGRYIVDRLPFNFQKVTGDFWCPIRLETLEGSPKYVGGNFLCKSLRFDSLEGAPEVIEGEFVSDQFTDNEYRTFAKKRKYVDDKLDKDLDVNLDDFS